MLVLSGQHGIVGKQPLSRREREQEGQRKYSCSLFAQDKFKMLKAGAKKFNDLSLSFEDLHSETGVKISITSMT